VSLAHTARQTRAAMTISEFCTDHRISRSKYYQLKAKGLGPDEMRFGDEGQIVLITQEAAARFRKRHTRRAVPAPGKDTS
jgi:hypothetical protein